MSRVWGKVIFQVYVFSDDPFVRNSCASGMEAWSIFGYDTLIKITKDGSVDG